MIMKKELTAKEMNFVRGGGAPSDSTSTKQPVEKQAPKDTTSNQGGWYVPTESAGGYTVTTKNNPPK
jgi:hypothetical protein